MTRCVIWIKGRVILARHDMAESNFEDYGKECPMVGPVWLSRVFAGAMRGIHANRIVARPNTWEFLLSKCQELWPKLGLGPRPETGSGYEFVPEFKLEFGLGYKFESEPPGNLGDSRTPLVSH